jgi:predicted dehydrogenase
LVGFYDPNQENADKISKEFGYKHFSTIATLIHAVDVIDIVTQLFPITNVQVAIKSGKHVLSKNPFQTPLKKRKKLLL